MRFKLLLSTLVFLSACQTRLSFEGRRYTKGVYWSITHSKKFKKNTTDKQLAQELEPVKPINQQASCQKVPLLIQTFEKAPISNIKTQEPLNVKQRYIKKAPSYVKANTHSKAHKKLNSESKLKSILFDDKYIEIFKIIMLCIFNLWAGIISVALIYYTIFDAIEIILPTVVFVCLFAYLFYINFKRIKKFKASLNPPLEKPKRKLINWVYILLLIILNIINVFIILLSFLLLLSFFISIYLDSAHVFVLLFAALLGFLISFGLLKLIKKIIKYRI